MRLRHPRPGAASAAPPRCAGQPAGTLHCCQQRQQLRCRRRHLAPQPAAHSHAVPQPNLTRSSGAAGHRGPCPQRARRRMPWADALGTSPACAVADAGGNAAAAAAAPAAISQAPSTKTFDVVHLGNLCLDIIVPVDQLPPLDTGLLPWHVVQPLVLNLRLLNPQAATNCCYSPHSALYVLASSRCATCHQPVAYCRRLRTCLPALRMAPLSSLEFYFAYAIYADLPDPCRAAVRAELLANLTATPPPQTAWEVGGASNFMIAAARLGQHVASIGQLGDDVYGAFFRRVMQVCVSLIYTDSISISMVVAVWSCRCQLYRHSLHY